MLQQTRTEAVTGYYERFMRACPTVEALAAAELETVLKLWEGLGYYSRARNLHRAARWIVAEHGGVFPRTAAEIAKLPGVGAYTAGAVASIAFGEKACALDANQLRVLSRLAGCEEDVSKPHAKRMLGAFSLSLMPDDRPGDYNQMLMDIGASICLPHGPRCLICPARAYCQAYRLGAQERIPLLPAKPARRVEKLGVALVRFEDKLLVRRRDEKGLLGGLWELPYFLAAETADGCLAGLAEMGLCAQALPGAVRARHVFTHLVWEMRGFYLRAADERAPQGWRWVDAKELEALPMGSAMRVCRQAALNWLEEDGK